MARKEQVTPLAPAANWIRSDEEEVMLQSEDPRRRKYVQCFGCCMAGMVIQATVIILLFLTVFHVKDPNINMNSVKIDRLELISGRIPRPGVNMTMTADFSIKNPNVASFKYRNTTTTLFYRGVVIGVAWNSAGMTKAKRTQRINVTVDIIPDQLINNPYLNSDMDSRILTMNSYTRISGRVKIVNIIKKHITVNMNCSITVNITSKEVEEHECKRHHSLRLL